MASLSSPHPLSLSKKRLGFSYFGLTRKLRFLSPQGVHLMQIKDDSISSRLIGTQSIKFNDSNVTCEALCKINWSIEIILDPELSVCLTGDPFELGWWDPQLSIPLSPSNSNSSIWQAQIEVPYGIHFKYNYLIKGGRNFWKNSYRKGPILSLSTPEKSERNINKEINVRDCWLRYANERVRVPSWDSWLFGLSIINDSFLLKNESAYPALFSAFTGEQGINSSKTKPLSIKKIKNKENPNKKNISTEDHINEKFLSFLSTDIKATDTKEKLPLSHLFTKEKPVPVSSTDIKAAGTKKKPASSIMNYILSKEKPVSINGTDIKAAGTEEKSSSSTEIKAVVNEEKTPKNKENFTEEPWYQTLANLRHFQELNKEKEVIRKIIINSSCNMRKIVVLEDEKIVELILKPLNDNVLCNNIYLGVIKKMATKKGGAFVDIGLSEPAFMILEKNREPFVYDSKRAKMKISKNGGENGEKWENLGNGTNVIVQVIGTGETGTVTVLPYPTITSRFWILKTQDDKIEVSNSIQNSERKNLFEIAKKFKPNGFGLLVKKEAAGVSFKELQKDLDILLSAWELIEQNAESALLANKGGVEGSVPVLLYRAFDQNLSTFYDYFPDKIQCLLVDSPHSYHEVTVEMQQIAPELCSRVEIYNMASPIFDKYKIDEEINRILCKRVPLPDCGNLVIEQTEGVVSIDVNSGRSTTQKQYSQEKSALKVNLAAANQIARELRLRDIGGVIIVDFIDLSKESSGRLLYEEMKREVERDRSKVTISKISPLGLMQITREKINRTGSFMVNKPCECCHATGRVEALETCFSKIERQISLSLAASDKNQNQKIQKTQPRFELKVDNHVCEYLTSGKTTRLDILRRVFRVLINLKVERGFSRGEFELTQLGDEKEICKEATSELEVTR